MKLGALKKSVKSSPNYCMYHRMLGHPTKSCYVFKDILQALIDAEVLKLRPEQKKVAANMTSFLQFGRQPPTPSGVVPVPRGELRVVNTDPHQQQEKGLVPVFTPQGESCGFIPTLWMASNGPLLPVEGPKAKRKLHPVMWCALLPGKRKLMFPH